VPHGRGNETTHRGGPDRGAADGLGRKPRDVYMPDLRLGSGIKVPTRNFR
jgi:error-prone DNA polymerase